MRIEDIKNQEDFINFIKYMHYELINNKKEWENDSLESFLEALAAYSGSVHHAYNNIGKIFPSDINWQFFAQLLYSARYYE